MEVNLSNLKFSSAYTTTFILINIFAPPLLFLVVYNFNLFLQIESVKLLLLSFCAGAIVFVLNSLIVNIILGIVESYTKGKDMSTDDELDLPDSVALIVSSGANLITICNLIYLRYFLYVKKVYWLKSSIETWLLTEFILVILLILLCIAGIKYAKRIPKTAN